MDEIMGRRVPDGRFRLSDMRPIYVLTGFAGPASRMQLGQPGNINVIVFSLKKFEEKSLKRYDFTNQTIYAAGTLGAHISS
jgi:hypothetical protein